MNAIDDAPMPLRPLLPLAAGAEVAVLAPAGPVDAALLPALLPAITALYARHGLRARLMPSCLGTGDYLAGPDAARLADLHTALADPAIAAIHALRGGYGCLRLLDAVDTALLRAHPKLLIGYSDLTALHALWAREGVASLHAPMPASDLLKPGHDAQAQADADALFALLRTGWPAGTVLAPALEPGRPHHGGVAEGRLVGGNLSLLAALMGTPWAWDAHHAIVFIEDVHEEPYRVDRLLTQLRLGGVLGAAAGFVLGSFTDEAYPDALLRELLLPLGKPVLGGWPAGHGTPNRPLPLGLPVRLDADVGTLTLLQAL